MCNNIISRLRREAGGSSLARKRMKQLWENSEPRPPETTGALVFGWPPKGRSVQVELASHERAAVVQHLAESGWLPNRSFLSGVYVAGKRAESRSLSASRATADSATAVLVAANKPAERSSATTTESISKVSRGEGATRRGNGRIAFAWPKRK